MSVIAESKAVNVVDFTICLFALPESKKKSIENNPLRLCQDSHYYLIMFMFCNADLP